MPASGIRCNHEGVVLLLDDLSWHDVGAYGNRDVRTSCTVKLIKSAGGIKI